MVEEKLCWFKFTKKLYHRNVAPPAGFEPATFFLTGSRSTVELQGNVKNEPIIPSSKALNPRQFVHIFSLVGGQRPRRFLRLPNR